VCPEGRPSSYTSAERVGSNPMGANVVRDMGGRTPQDGARGQEENPQAAAPIRTFLEEVPGGTERTTR
jgi:hypothetical protein